MLRVGISKTHYVVFLTDQLSSYCQYHASSGMVAK